MLHEIKHDGFRVIARKDGPRVRLYSRPGNDLTHRFPLIELVIMLTRNSVPISALNIMFAAPRNRRETRDRARKQHL
jgi:hypothetical protein